MDYLNIRINTRVAAGLKILADKETEKRGVSITKTFILNEIVTEYLKKALHELPPKSPSVSDGGFRFPEENE